MGRFRGRVESNAEAKRVAIEELFRLGLAPAEIAWAGNLCRTTVDRALSGLKMREPNVRPLQTDATPFAAQLKRFAELWTNAAPVPDPRANRIVREALRAHLEIEHMISMFKGWILRDLDDGPNEGSEEYAESEALRVADLCFTKMAKKTVPVPKDSPELLMHLVNQRQWLVQKAQRNASG